MPTSRRRKRRSKATRVPVHPYESLVRGVMEDEALRARFERAMWSFHRGPFPSQSDELLQNAAAARAFEWFLFDAARGGYLNLPGSTPATVSRFFDAAARFYRAAPWRVLADDRWIELTVPGFRAPDVRTDGESALHATAVIMGNGGKTFGLALYFNQADLDALVRGAPPAASLEFDTLAVTFDAERNTEPDVISEAKEHRWPIAGRKAYPSGLRTTPDAPPRLIAGDELDLASAALDAVREFVSMHETALRDPDARYTKRIDVPYVGAVTLTLEPEVLAEAE